MSESPTNLTPEGEDVKDIKKIPTWFNWASGFLVCLGAFLIISGWWKSDTHGSWVLATSGLWFLFFGWNGYLMRRLRQLREIVEEVQKKHQH